MTGNPPPVCPGHLHDIPEYQGYLWPRLHCHYWRVGWEGEEDVGSVECPVLAITSAKVPIAKLYHTQASIDADISLYNILARENTKLFQLQPKQHQKPSYPVESMYTENILMLTILSSSSTSLLRVEAEWNEKPTYRWILYDAMSTTATQPRLFVERKSEKTNSMTATFQLLRFVNFIQWLHSKHDILFSFVAWMDGEESNFGFDVKDCVHPLSRIIFFS